MEGWTTIAVSKDVKDRLKSEMKDDEAYDAVIRRFIGLPVRANKLVNLSQIERGGSLDIPVTDQDRVKMARRISRKLASLMREGMIFDMSHKMDCITVSRIK